ncbi:MAG: hypothetical protein FWD56_06280, partial [Bacteroidales bacterium]|nr:hypothetical protein [Bacteroidales bacterium]
MKKTLLLSIAAMLFLTTAYGQSRTAREQTILNVFGRLNLSENPYENLNCWTDGEAYYRPFFFSFDLSDREPRFSGNTIYLNGGTLHEGGIVIKVQL